VARYDQSGLLTMVLQEFIEWDHYVRCMCLGQEKVLPMKYDPESAATYHPRGHLAPELGDAGRGRRQKLVRRLGYDMNTCEFAVRDGVPYAIDFMNPAPDMDVNSLTPLRFPPGASATWPTWCIDLAKNPRRR
jgi:hypothetical protein